MSALFPEPERLAWTLSVMYGVRAYRVRTGETAKWMSQHSRKPCDECFAVQHEDRESLKRTRATASTRRTQGGTQLLLCGAHAELWKVRDAEDTT